MKLEKEIENKDSKSGLEGTSTSRELGVVGGFLVAGIYSWAIALAIFLGGGLGVRRTTTEYISKYKNTPVIVKKEDVRFGGDRYYITLNGSKISKGEIIDDYDTMIKIDKYDFSTYYRENGSKYYIGGSGLHGTAKERWEKLIQNKK